MNKQQFVIDRFEGAFAVCEPFETHAGCEPIDAPGDLSGRRAYATAEKPGAHINISREMIDKRAGEGAIIYYCECMGRYLYDEDATRRRALYINELAKGIWKS